VARRQRPGRPSVVCRTLRISCPHDEAPRNPHRCEKYHPTTRKPALKQHPEGGQEEALRASGRWIRGLAAAVHLRSGPKLVARTPRGAGSVSRRPERQETQKKPPDAARRTSSTEQPWATCPELLCKVTVTRARRRHAAGGWRASCGGGRVGPGAAFHRHQRSLAVHTGPGGGPPRWSPTALTLEAQRMPEN
jgi:hypothetical protein